MTTGYARPDKTWLREKLKFKPTGPEQSAILDTDGRFIMVSGGEQAGKSYITAMFAFERSFEFDEPPLIWLVARRYQDTAREYDYLLDFYNQFGWVARASRAQPDKFREFELVDGTVVRTITAFEEKNIGRDAPQIILGCEAAQLSYEAFMKLRIRAEAGRGYLLMTGTVEDLTWYRQIFTKWLSGTDDNRAYSLPSYTNPYTFEGGKDGKSMTTLREILGDDLFSERIEGIPRKMKGLVFGNEFNPEIHIREVEYIPGLPVHFCIDPGYNQAVHALLAIQCPPERPIQVFDEIYRNDYLTTDVIQAAQNREWWKDTRKWIPCDRRAGHPCSGRSSAPSGSVEVNGRRHAHVEAGWCHGRHRAYEVVPETARVLQ